MFYVFIHLIDFSHGDKWSDVTFTSILEAVYLKLFDVKNKLPYHLHYFFEQHIKLS